MEWRIFFIIIICSFVGFIAGAVRERVLVSEKFTIKFARWCLLHRYKGRGYDWENVELLYKIYNNERKNNPDMDL